MFCPECNLENHSSAKFCIHCGSVLTQAELTAPSANRTNQVWNTEIEQEKNKQNRRTAMIALGAVIVLILALAVCVWIALPSMGDALIGEGADSESFTDRLSDFWDDFMDSFEWDGRSPEPERVKYIVELSEITGTADDEFLTDFPALVTFTYDNCYDSIWAVEQERAFLTPYRSADFEDPQLQQLALEYIGALDTMTFALSADSDGELYIDDYDTWDSAYAASCLAIKRLQDQYRIFTEDDLHIPIYYAANGMTAQEQYRVQKQFESAVTGIRAQWDEQEQAYTITLTNTEPYIAAITMYNDYETEDEWLYENDSFLIAPGETVNITLEEMPDEWLNWYIELYLKELYYDEDYSLYDYYWDYYFDLYTS